MQKKFVVSSYVRQVKDGEYYCEYTKKFWPKYKDILVKSYQRKKPKRPRR